jgi:hypothetical protein
VCRIRRATFNRQILLEEPKKSGPAEPLVWLGRPLYYFIPDGCFAVFFFFAAN